jgi:hypothetical protein
MKSVTAARRQPASSLASSNPAPPQRQIRQKSSLLAWGEARASGKGSSNRWAMERC